MSFFNITNITNAISLYAHQAYETALNYKNTNIDPLIEKTDCFQPDEKKLLITSLASAAILFVGGLTAARKSKSIIGKGFGLLCSALAVTNIYYQYVTLNNFTCSE